MSSNPFTENYPNTCTSCGFLSIITPEKDNKGPHEVDANRRDQGSISDRQLLWCFRRMDNLEFDVQLSRNGHESAGTEPDKLATDKSAPHRFPFVREVLRKDRSLCTARGAWHEWVEHFGPKWHYEDWRMMELEKLRQSQAKMLAEVMQGHKEVTEKLTAITSDQGEASDRQEKSNRRFNRLFIAIGLIAILLALAPLAYPDGIEWLVDHIPGAERSITPPPQSTPGMEGPQLQ